MLSGLSGLSALSGLVGEVAAPPFVPTDIAGLALWLAADDIASLYKEDTETTPVSADSDPLGSWRDKSGNGRHHRNSTGTERPTYKTGVQNGLPAILFDGTDDNLIPIVGLDTLTAATLLMVAKLQNDPPAVGSKTGLLEYTNAALKTAWPWTDGVIYQAFGTNTRKTTVNPTPSLAVFNVSGVVTASGEYTTYLNGTQTFTTATNTVGWSTAANSRVGKSLGAPIGFLDGWIGEILVYDSVLSTTNRQLVEAYLKAKWGTP